MEKMEKMKNETFAVLDVETGGWSKTKNGLCEIGFIIIDHQFKILESYQALIKPYKREGEEELVSYKDDSMKVHGIRMEDIENGGEAGIVGNEIFKMFKEFNTTGIIGHNVVFDDGWMQYFMGRFGHGFKFKRKICTMKLARTIKNLPVENHKLPTLLKHYGVEEFHSHRALDDADSTLYILKRILFDLALETA